MGGGVHLLTSPFSMSSRPPPQILSPYDAFHLAFCHKSVTLSSLLRLLLYFLTFYDTINAYVSRALSLGEASQMNQNKRLLLLIFFRAWKIRLQLTKHDKKYHSLWIGVTSPFLRSGGKKNTSFQNYISVL